MLINCLCSSESFWSTGDYLLLSFRGVKSSMQIFDCAGGWHSSPRHCWRISCIPSWCCVWSKKVPCDLNPLIVGVSPVRKSCIFVFTRTAVSLSFTFVESCCLEVRCWVSWVVSMPPTLRFSLLPYSTISFHNSIPFPGSFSAGWRF